jgi:hypothetical protein
MMRAFDVQSAASLEATDDQQLDAELKLARLRVAVVWTLTDHIEQFAHEADVEGVREQLVEEMAWLGCWLFEAASSMAKRRRLEQSGAFRRSLASDDLPIVSA